MTAFAVPPVRAAASCLTGDRAQLLGLEVELETSEERMEQEQAALYRVLASASQDLLLSRDSRRGWRKTTFVFGWRTAAIAQRSAGDERK